MPMGQSEIDAVRALLSSKPRPVGWAARRQRIEHTRFAAAAGAANVAVTLEIWPDMIHAWPMWNALLSRAGTRSQTPANLFAATSRLSAGTAPHASAFSAALPAYFAWLPSSCSMRSNWLYLAVRSDRASDPVLIWPQLVATARSAMVESSVSPERCDITAV